MLPRVQCEEGHMLPRIQCEERHVLTACSVWRRSRVATCSVWRRSRVKCEGHVLSASSILRLQAGQLARSMAATWSILDRKSALGWSIPRPVNFLSRRNAWLLFILTIFISHCSTCTLPCGYESLSVVTTVPGCCFFLNLVQLIFYLAFLLLPVFYCHLTYRAAIAP